MTGKTTGFSSFKNLFSLDDYELDAFIEKLIGIGYLVEVEENLYEYANGDN